MKCNWIPVQNSLPDEEVFVLIFTRKCASGITVGCYAEGEWSVMVPNEDYAVNVEGVEFWAYLPNYPFEDKDPTIEL
jgi:hypothetical protein